MAELTLVEAVNDALHTELARDADVMVLGEDVGRAGGVFRATAGLRDRFGADRCVDTPLAEAGLLGGAVGLCMAGWRPVVEMQYDAFSYPCLDQLITHVGRYHWRTRRADAVPAHDPHAVRRRRARAGAARRLARGVLRAHAGHQGRDPVDACGCEGPARRGDPRSGSGRRSSSRSSCTARRAARCRRASYVVPLGKARIAREGTDVTLIAYGAMVQVCERAADALDVSCEVVDIRSLRPLDEETILASVAKTGRVVIVHEAPRTAGFGAELAALIAERAIFDLQGPVLRVTGYDVPYPYWTIEDAYMPSVERVVAAVRVASRDSRAAARAARRCTATSRGTSSRCSTIDPGDSVRFATPNAGWWLDDEDAVRAALARPRTTATRSPARSRCAARAPAQTLVVQIDEVVPGPVGRDVRRAAAPDRLGARRTASAAHRRASVVTLAPFLGVMGMPPVGPGVHSTIPPRPQGGNIDCKELVAGHDALPADPGRRRALLGRRRSCRARRRRGQRHRDRVPVDARS